VETIQLVPIDRTRLTLRRLKKFHLKKETDSSLRNVVFEIKEGTVDNAQSLPTAAFKGAIMLYHQGR
jgi:hypothetical protein